MEKSIISRETLVALHETEGLGWKTIRMLWDRRTTYPVHPGMGAADLRDCGLGPKAAAAAAASLSPQRMEASRRRRESAGIGVLTWADRAYPDMLKHTDDPPAVLYYKGRRELLERPAVGVVGTRLATAYGRHVAEEYAAFFSSGGVAVASGLARGIDACAHRGALRGSGGTIAVLGTPVDQIYPPENRQLYREIEAEGLLLSEAPPGTPYHPGMFPSRNRIIAGLSLGVVVVEAPDGSGALITADYAILAGRPVFVVPGPVTSPRCRGGLRMLKEGTADALIDPADVLARFHTVLGPLPDGAAGTNGEPETGDLPEPESTVYFLLLEAPRTIDELSAAAGLPVGQLHEALLSLQLKRKITLMPGSLYSAL